VFGKSPQRGSTIRDILVVSWVSYARVVADRRSGGFRLLCYFIRQQQKEMSLA
jgi:hypothetical protein